MCIYTLCDNKFAHGRENERERKKVRGEKSICICALQAFNCDKKQNTDKQLIFINFSRRHRRPSNAIMFALSSPSIRHQHGWPGEIEWIYMLEELLHVPYIISSRICRLHSASWNMDRCRANLLHCSSMCYNNGFTYGQQYR